MEQIVHYRQKGNTVRVTVELNGQGYRWMAGDGDRVWARAVIDYPDEISCRTAAGKLSDASLPAMTARQQPDGRWRWLLAGDDGHPLAESPVAFTDARACGLALRDAQRILSEIIGWRPGH